jgi:hypothetical protein
VVVDLAMSREVSEERARELHAALEDAGLGPTRVIALRRASAQEIEPAIWFIFGVVAAGLVKPSAEAVGNALKGQLAEVIRIIRRLGRPHELMGVQINGEDGRAAARYWLPAGAEREKALATLDEHYASERSTELDRRWVPGRGWMTNSQMWAHLRKEERPPDPGIDG